MTTPGPHEIMRDPLNSQWPHRDWSEVINWLICGITEMGTGWAMGMDIGQTGQWTIEPGAIRGDCEQKCQEQEALTQDLPLVGD